MLIAKCTENFRNKWNKLFWIYY